ncbi:MAG: flippase-like domain-containing protein [Alphaproteobacteria bacterium]|nr:flippase-like domain-containing protein [Alphaproteobacteria bacterium]
MKTSVIFGALAGLGLTAFLIAWSGVGAVGNAIAMAGWRGVGAVTLFQLVPVILCGLAWRMISGKDCPASGATFVWARFLRDGVGQVLAVLPLAEPVLAARMLVLRGVSGAMAVTTVVADLTMEVLSQVAFTLLGVGLLFVRRPDSNIIHYALIGAAVAAPAVIGFLLAQRKGLFSLMERLAHRLSAGWEWPAGDLGQALDQGLEVIYSRPLRVLAAFFLHLLGWIVSCGGSWIGLRFMGHPLTFAECVALESLVFAIRNVAFMVPWGAGVQEGGYAVVGALFGLGPETALGFSLLKRARDVVMGVPSILVWQLVESRRLLRKDTGA